ncbi:uncharacterized protein LOC121380374 [Gigantopelta aegis]|uniref:uncharacterized protein LOC121380374 n=1 Tax=Gigantopelta aegis TaxID=1735272 RepID=UPI001B888532|nr:uncharacterized protein LOC121380374 [Gigantopelta aegis]
MDEQNNRVLEIVSEDGQVVQNTISAAVATCTGPASLSGEFNANQVQWTALGPQNTYITFHTLPFNLDQIQGAAELTAVGEGSELAIISSDGTVVGGPEQFVLSDSGSSKQYVLPVNAGSKQFILSDSGSSKEFVLSDSTNSKQFILSDSGSSKEFVLSDSTSSKQFILSDSGSSKEFVLSDSTSSKQYVLSDGAGSKPFVLSDSAGSKPFVLPDNAGSKQYVVSDRAINKHSIAFTKSAQTEFILQTGAGKKEDVFPMQSHFIIQSGTDGKPAAFSDPGQSDGQSQVILQTSVHGKQNTSYMEPDHSRFIIQNASGCVADPTYTEPDLSGFILQNSSQDSHNTSFVEPNPSQFTAQATAQGDHNTLYTDPNRARFVLQNGAEGKSDAGYSKTDQSNLASQVVMETGAGGKMDAVVPRSVPTEISSENKSQTLEYPQLPTTDVDKLSVFSNVCVSISSTLLDVIPDCESVLLDEVQSETNARLQKTDLGYSVTGSLDMVVHLYNHLQELLNIPGSSRLKFVGEEVTKPEVHHRGTNCNILVPFVSSRGREIHQPSRYGGCLQLQELDDEDDDDGDHKPVLSRRGRKSQPKKLRGTVVSMKSEEVLKKTNVSKPLDALTYTAAGTTINMPEDVQKQYNYDSSLEYTPKYTGSKKPERPGKQYEALSPFKFFCPMCSFRTKRESHFEKHRKLHENNSTKLQHCSKCNFVSVRLSVLRRHEIIHSTHVFQCNICAYKADNLKLLRRHRLLRHESNQEKRNQLKFCPDCEYKTVHNTLYHRHLQTHASTRALPTNGATTEYVCNECSYTTIRKEHYIRHRKNVHGNARPFLCDTCGMAFKRPDTLAQHKIVHVDRKDRLFAFNCSQCNKGFRSQAHLKEHETMHSKDRPFLCDHCGASFKTPQVQKKHIQTIHLNPRSFSCGECNKCFNTKYALHRHLRTHELQQQQQTDLQAATVDIEQTDIPSLSTDQLSEIDPDTLQTIQTQQALDVVGAAMEESFDQSDETLHQAYIQPNETTTALLYLTGNLQNIEYNPS